MNKHLLETKNRGSFLFPFEQYHTEDESESFFVSCHYHPELEILHMKKGHIMLFLDGQSFPVHKDTIVFINREEIHALNAGCSGISYDAFVFPPELLSFHALDYCQQKYLLPLIQKKLFFPRILTPDTPCYPQVRDQLLALSTLHSRFPDGYQMATRAALYQILSCLILSDSMLAGEKQPHSPDSRRLATMRGILSYIQNHLSEKITLQQISASFYMTPNYFCKYFKDSFGVTFTTCLNEIRLERACELLTESDISITEAGMQSGFDNLSYFIRLFKDKKGVTPSQYRKLSAV